MRKFLLALLFLAPLALAQNTVTVTASQIYLSYPTQLLPAGTIIFQPVNSSGQNISYQIGGTGNNVTAPTVCSIVTGAIVQPCIVANVATALPQNFFFSV